MTEPNRNARQENPREIATPKGIPGPGGVVLDQYVLLETLSSSRTGLIFKARHRLMGRIVAVKFLSAEAAASTTLTARFHRAIQILARLQHRNLVTALEAGEKGGVHYLVMEYFDGRDLRSIVKEKNAPLSVAEAVQFTLQAAAGLAVAHQQGVCHRNIKPGNLLVDHDGLLKIVGFTLAHVEAGGAASESGVEDNLTRQGQVLGTYEYMAPEQAMDSSSVDRRADIYSLGCTLHFLVTGRQPYVTSPGMKQVLAHRAEAIPSLCTARPEVPAALDRVFQKMVAKSPAGRYASMEQVITDLEASLTAPKASQLSVATAPAGETTADNLRAAIGLPSSAARPAATDKPVPKSKSRPAKRGPHMVPLVVGGVLGVLAFVVGVQYFQSKPPPEAAKGETPRTSGEDSAAGPATGPASSQAHLPNPSSDASPVTKPNRPVPFDDTAWKPAPAPKPEPKPLLEPKPGEEPARPPVIPVVAAVMPAKPDVTPAVSEAAHQKPSDSRLPVPDEPALQRGLQLVRDLFQEDLAKARSPAEKSALAQKMLLQANGIQDDPAGRYAMLNAGCALAKEAVDPATAIAGADSIARYYAVDALSTKVNMLPDFAKVAKSSLQHRAVAQEASALTRKAMQAGQFETAATLSALAVAEAGIAHDPQTSTRVRVQAREVEKAVAAYRDYAAAKAVLRDAPNDPAANLFAGRYECVTFGSWNAGLRKLAAGSNETLRTLAAKELAEPKDPDQQSSLADGWWDLANEQSGAAGLQFYRHAAFWYAKASAQATGLLKGKIEKRLEAIKTIETKAAVGQ